eukprot:1856659-Amphidinium_carterae.1
MLHQWQGSSSSQLDCRAFKSSDTVFDILACRPHKRSTACKYASLMVQAERPVIFVIESPLRRVLPVECVHSTNRSNQCQPSSSIQSQMMQMIRAFTHQLLHSAYSLVKFAEHPKFKDVREAQKRIGGLNHYLVFFKKSNDKRFVVGSASSKS